MIDYDVMPAIAAVASDAESHICLALRVQARANTVAARLPLNLAIVLDRSGSMGGAKLERAQAAACRAVDQLQAGDRLAVVTFDDEVEVVVPSGPVGDPEAVKALIQGIRTGGSTALAAGWDVGMREVGRFVSAGALNRVLLLSDGQANIGLTDPEEIARRVKQGDALGVSTSALGVGDDYQENLMMAIAQAGDGNFWHIDSAAELVSIFDAELQGLLATVGRRVSLRCEPTRGVAIADVMNDFEKLPTGGFKLPNLVVGKPRTIVLKLAVEKGFSGGPLVNFRLAYDDLSADTRVVQRWGFELPLVPRVRLEEFSVDSRVMTLVTLFEVARQRQQAIDHLRTRQFAAAREVLQNILQRLEALPQSHEVRQEHEKTLELIHDLDSYRHEKVIKKNLDMIVMQQASR